MKDFFEELIWAIVHDEDTKIILAIAIACVSIGISLAAILT